MENRLITLTDESGGVRRDLGRVRVSVRAVELLRVGFHFSRLPRFARTHEEQAMFDVWMTFVMPHEVVRDWVFSWV